MRTCPKCKTEYPDDKKYCKTCGAQLLSNKEVDPKFSARKMVIEEKIRTDPLNISLLNQFAELLIENHLYDEAILNLYKVLAIEEGNLKAQRYLFHCLNATDKTKEAAEIGYKLVDLIPGNTDLLLEIALLSMGQGDNSRAVDYFDRIIKNDPKRKDAWKYKAVVLDKMGDKESSFKAWNIVYSIDSNDTDAKLYLGIEAAKNGEYVKAKEFIEFFIKKIDDKTQKRFLGLVYLAKSYLNLNIDENSIRNLYSEIISISQPDWLDEEVKLILSEIAFSLGQKALEREDYNNALSYFENIKEYGNAKKSKEACALTYYKMSEEYLNKKEYENAEYYMNESLKLDPANEEVKGKHSEISNKINIAKKKKRKSNIIKLFFAAIFIIIAVFVMLTFQKYVHNQNEDKVWEDAKQLNTSESYQTYLSEYPDGKYIRDALAFKEESLWKETQAIHSIESYQKYNSLFPNGKYKEIALENILLILRGGIGHGDESTNQTQHEDRAILQKPNSKEKNYNNNESSRINSSVSGKESVSEGTHMINIALNKPCYITTNGAEKSQDAEFIPQLTDNGNFFGGIKNKLKATGSHSYVSYILTDGDVESFNGWVNRDYNQLMKLNVTIDFQDEYEITSIRYNVGKCMRSTTWNADKIITPIGSSITKPGYEKWTEIKGNIISSKLKITFEKTRVSWETDWLMIGEIEVYGTKVQKK